jgi:predicted nuclease with TOPRIM domain
MEGQVWNIILSVAMGATGFIIKNLFDELKRIQILLNRTREELPKEYVTRAQLDADVNRIFDRLDRLEVKLDKLMEKHS